MSKRLKKPDRVLLTLLATLVTGGFFIFLSASLGLLARGKVSFTSIAFNQFFLGIVLGSLLAFIASRIPYASWRRYAPALFGVAVLGTFLVFVPGVGMEWGGAARWVHFGPVTFQPAELLKIGVVLFAAHVAATYAQQIAAHSWFGIVSLGGIVVAIGVPMLLQPDTDTFLVMATAVVAMYFVAGLRWRDVGIIAFVAVVGLTTLVIMRPYVLDRVTTFMHPADDARGSGYQIQQSLIAVGSGKAFGRGFGQSVQKFNYLPEPIGDSIFAVYAEEFGFLGSVVLLILIAAFILRLLWLATRARELFGALVLVGVAVVIGIQSLLNIAAMLAVVPLAGLPLIFVSHGGTAMASSLLSMGIAINISRYRTK